MTPTQIRRFPIRSTDIKTIAPGIDPDELSLEYEISPQTNMKGERTGRFELRPVLDLGDYKFRAEIDWVEFEARTVETSQSRHIHALLQKALVARGFSPKFWVGGQKRARKTGAPRGSVTGEIFWVRLQDPTPKLVRAVIAVLMSSGKIEVDTEMPRVTFPVTGIEVAVDVYPNKDGEITDHEWTLMRLKMSEHLRKHFAPSDLFNDHYADRLRWVGRDKQAKHLIYGPKPRDGEARFKSLMSKHDVSGFLRTASIANNHRSAPVEATVYVGQNQGPVMWRLQDKTHDERRGETAKMLPIEKRRSRIEVTMLKTDSDWEGDHHDVPGAIGLEGLWDLNGFKFERLRTMGFNFHIPTVDCLKGDPLLPDETEIEIFAGSGVYGLRRYQHAKQIDVKGNAKRPHGKANFDLNGKGHMTVDAETTARVTDALKRLTERWRSKGERARKAV
ncbi:hypothetical protein BD830_10747 [Maritimibacter alkaliphilus HTCC2654]|uniref:Uncharacterized protein n=1 Tax=Maritimibacter alkaliphilus HTCC2654 TaxID=314271 RepID=A3VLG3_9RHOB|nr:hypothetical protein [Maritimibacter alkaliphilus]EAQ10851.1 hypothetical protein RB2654_21823 [Rhodobacterales bacterium HTCC2654] [Maritimibacter alkaliphilus HTCC2654]TYP80496.1 hypothetical protein BD830_10747 [Maritimibacter alkaliphilus HTCC2654]